MNQMPLLYEQAGRGNGDWFHFMVVGTDRRPDSQTQLTGHWRAGDWIDGMSLVLRTRDGRRVAITGAEMEPPLNSASEARGQRRLVVPELGPLTSSGCLHAAR
ncbi:hypothetical protein [Actinacidiphila acidipaludis]|uniref:Uncharacterized protein n=1 Tax=Actinacidiphila acidipaludis TaxID=2873382 RepID=A0ABS7QHN5_9ACTN|nr:hypothetical protein [Streptomyces acidipaludis]MBY8882683.1 hypothetical protein [Streptomyces acidipaludis]